MEILWWKCRREFVEDIMTQMLKFVQKVSNVLAKGSVHDCMGQEGDGTN